MRIRELDGLRGMAILAVVMYHYARGFTLSGAQFGWLGVNLFFILSGFLITSILIKLKGRRDYFSVFYMRRALRIFPLYYLAIGIYIASGLITHRTLSATTWASYIFYYSSLIKNQPSHVVGKVPLSIQLGLGVLWSLSVEEIFYTIWAPIVRWTSKRTFAGILVVAIVLAPILRWQLHTPNYLELFLFYCRMDGLALGSLIALAVSHRKQSQRLVELDTTFDRLTVTLLLFTVGFWAVTGGDKTTVTVASLGVFLVDISCALIVYSCVRRAGQASWWTRALRLRWLRSIGEISYSWYLFHYPILVLVSVLVMHFGMSHRWGFFTEVVIAFAGSLAVSYLIRSAIERPIERWKQANVPSEPVATFQDIAPLRRRFFQALRSSGENLKGLKEPSDV